MNTDNMSILGLTIDYGPFQFLDAYQPGHICNHSDTQGRYAFNRQPNVAYWNLHCLAQALLPLIEEQSLALAALEAFKTVFLQAFERRMRTKLGLLDSAAPEDRALVEDILSLMARSGVDYTIFWRRLSHSVGSGDVTPVRDLFLDAAGLDAWWLRHSQRIGAASREQLSKVMLASNPKFVLRNHLAELAIQSARKKDFAPIASLLEVLETPFDEHPEFEHYADFPPDWARSIEISCSS
jgi:uncharacterized protein YdiU (UPF0061 family)